MRKLEPRTFAPNSSLVLTCDAHTEELIERPSHYGADTSEARRRSLAKVPGCDQPSAMYGRRQAIGA